MAKKLPVLPKFFPVINLLLLFIMAGAFFYFTNGANILQVIFSKKVTVAERNILKQVPASQFHGWIAWWDEAAALKSLDQNIQKLQSVSPVWYKLDGQGNLFQIPHKANLEIKKLAQQSKIKLIPTITNDFDANKISIVLHNSDIYNSFTEELLSLAKKYDYQGFDIDWEEMNPKDQQSFTFFIEALAEKLHQNNLTLTVSVHPQTGQASDRKIVKAYDLAKLAKWADALKIMAYDFHNQNSNPGAITPFSELTKVLVYTSKIVPFEKIILGLPVYGYDWEKGTNRKADIVSFTQAQELITKHNGQIQRDLESASLVGNYRKNGQEHVIWFEDAQTIREMIKKARSFGIYQFSFWRIGVEDSVIWTQYR